MPRISSKHQITLPVETLERAGLIVVSRRPPEPNRALGVFDGLYDPDYLEHLRAGERA
jgi:hypothetical protein